MPWQKQDAELDTEEAQRKTQERAASKPTGELNLLRAIGKKYQIIYADPPWSFSRSECIGVKMLARSHASTQSR